MVRVNTTRKISAGAMSVNTSTILYQSDAVEEAGYYIVSAGFLSPGDTVKVSLGIHVERNGTNTQLYGTPASAGGKSLTVLVSLLAGDIIKSNGYITSSFTFSPDGRFTYLDIAKYY